MTKHIEVIGIFKDQDAIKRKIRRDVAAYRIAIAIGILAAIAYAALVIIVCKNGINF